MRTMIGMSDFDNSTTHKPPTWRFERSGLVSDGLCVCSFVSVVVCVSPSKICVSNYR